MSSLSDSLVKNQPNGSSTRAWVRLFPILFFFGYLNFTVFLFVIGPWEYPVESAFRLYLFLALAHVALLIGYLSVPFRNPAGYSGKWTLSRLIKISVVLNLLLLLPTSHFRTGRFIPDVIGGITDPGGAYAQSFMLREGGGGGEPLIEYVRIVLGPLLYMALPLTVFYWDQLSRKMRIAGIVSILGTVALFIGMGTNKAIVDTVLLVPCLVLAANCAGRMKLSRKRVFGIAVASLLALLLALAYFGFAVSSREGSVVGAGYFVATHTHADEDNFLVRHLPPSIATVIIGLDLYLTSGYYALSLSLQEPFVPMYGVGNSMFLYRQAARMTGNARILERPYPVRIEKYGWDAQGLWSSIYPWIASDVSFPGTVVIVFLVGRLFAQSWSDTLRGDNPLAVVMFSIFIIVLFYFPANNQMVQSGEGLTAFWGTLILWQRSRGRVLATRTYARPAAIPA
jgi:hypothetical protein